jgi:anti-sigma factor RsiW
VSCNHSEDLLNAYLDGETDPAAGAGVEKTLRECPECARSFRNHQALRTSIKSGSLAFRAPAGLEARVRRALRDERRAATSPRWNWTWRRWLAIALPVAAVLVFGLLLLRPAFGPAGGLLSEELVVDHIRSLQADHLSDVASTDQHTVKPWFDGRLDFSPDVRDLAQQGYPLVGGRLDYAGHRALAALVYQRRQHVINLFVWPADGADAASAPKTAPVVEPARRGYNVIRWTRAGFVHAAVSDLNATELREFADTLSR